GAQRMDLSRAPMLRLQTTADPRGNGYLALLQIHHLVCDHESLDAMLAEVTQYVRAESQWSLPEPIPYRNHVAQALAHAQHNDSEEFFRGKLGDVEETTAPFGLANVHGGVTRIDQA